jgi:hypothetical protein
MATATYVLVVDGVLRKPGTNAVIEQGQALYWALAATGRLVLLCGEDEKKVDWFLRTNGFNKHVHLIPEDPTASPTLEGRRLQQIRQIRGTQANVQFVIEPDPRVALHLFNESIPVLAYLHPVFMQPAFRPGYKSVATPWEDLISEVEYQIDAKAANAYDHGKVEDE